MMSRIRREQEAKTALITSIARSQQALASILEQIAEVASCSDVTARKLAENIRVLSSYQGVMCETLTGITLNRVQQGRPVKPFIQEHCRIFRP
ncbi:hypothetical protein [Paenibacillus lemnae]|uniref:Uncharacterized protein n=1 Tax=Paenibacillus lemnae TaxID=1330551 RepID=A0A848M391_PAELE|nr:hypothetical protein [Paenibacillus lemnae]NMO95235.1 hypothetical protein [Paenibacillus lemnae]